MRMRDYAGLSRKESAKNALLVECGQHWEKLSEKIAIETMIRFLRSTGIVDKEFGEETINELNPPKFEKEVYRVGEIVTIKTDNFTFSSDWQGFEVLKKGTVIGQDDEKFIYAPYDETILIMPTKRLFRGKTAVRLAHRYKD
jgi:succinylglutamate desuccinylase